MEIAKPTIVNVDLTDANTEYSYTLPANTRGFTIRLRNPGYPLKVAVEEGESGTTYMTIPNGKTKNYKVKGSGATLYFQTTAGSQVAEILIWK